MRYPLGHQLVELIERFQIDPAVFATPIRVWQASPKAVVHLVRAGNSTSTTICMRRPNGTSSLVPAIEVGTVGRLCINCTDKGWGRAATADPRMADGFGELLQAVSSLVFVDDRVALARAAGDKLAQRRTAFQVRQSVIGMVQQYGNIAHLQHHVAACPEIATAAQDVQEVAERLIAEIDEMIAVRADGPDVHHRVIAMLTANFHWFGTIHEDAARDVVGEIKIGWAEWATSCAMRAWSDTIQQTGHRRPASVIVDELRTRLSEFDARTVDDVPVSKLRFPGANFATPGEWLNAEKHALAIEFFEAVLTRADAELDGVLAKTDMVWLALRPSTLDALQTRDPRGLLSMLDNGFPPVAVHAGAVYALPEGLASVIERAARPFGNGALATVRFTEPLTEAHADVIAGLIDNDPSATFGSAESLLDAARALAA
jgi:hypothetical protein